MDMPAPSDLPTAYTRLRSAFGNSGRHASQSRRAAGKSRSFSGAGIIQGNALIQL